MKYVKNHNFPETATDGVTLDKIKKYKFDRVILDRDSQPKWDGVFCYHMGFAKDDDDMQDKTEYYVNRGEDTTRPVTTQSRAAWFDGNIPPDCRILPFSQEIPEVLKRCD
jgi:hypothetical protein